MSTSRPPHWNEQAEAWDSGIQSPDWPHYHYYRTFNIILHGLIRPCRRLLELGCGTGGATLDMASSVDEILASDFSLQMIRKAKINLKSLNNSGVHVAVLDAQHIPATDGIFDGAFSRGALLNYVPNPTKVLVEIYRVLASGGLVVLDMITRKPGGEAKLYGTVQVETMLKDSGFVDITFKPIGMFVNLWRNRELMDFANRNRDILCRIEIEMNDSFKLDHSPMALVTARKAKHPS